MVESKSIFEEHFDNDYCYKILVTDVYDGDTITCDIDLGFNVKLSEQKIRLYGINCPEMRGKSRLEGIKSRDYLRELILNKQIKLYTLKDKKGKYGRWLGILVQGENILNQKLLDEGLAKEYII